MTSDDTNNPDKDSDASDDARALGALREQIDDIDRQIVDLLGRRAQAAVAVGKVKERTNAPVYRPEREAAIYSRLRQSDAALPLKGAALEAIYREIISACREVERRMRVAYLGPAGTFSEMAVQKHFGSGVDAIACSSLEEVFRTTETGDSDYGVVPVENSTEGAVNRTLDLFLQTPLIISGEISVPVHHTLMNQSGNIDSVSRVCGHPQALAQCNEWLTANLPDVPRVPVASNAEGARLAGEESDLAAIAAVQAATRYGLRPIRQGIQDVADNRTRFAVMGRYECPSSGNDQTSLVLSVPDKAGAVHRLIEPLARHGVSMKRFESRPARGGAWEYYFHIDLIGHPDDDSVRDALAEIRDNAAFFKVVGAYPRSEAD